VERGGKGGRLEREESQREEVHSRRLSLHVEKWKKGNGWGFVLRYLFQHLSCNWLRTILGEKRKREFCTKESHCERRRGTTKEEDFPFLFGSM